MSNTGVTNLADFNSWIDDQVDMLEDEGEKVMVMLAMDLWERIVYRTPVDTGRARNSWNVAWGSPDPDTPPPGDYPDDPPRPSIARGVSANKLHISSNLNYIIYLEQGKPGPGSDSAPEGMVKVSIENLVNAVNSGGL